MNKLDKVFKLTMIIGISLVSISVFYVWIIKPEVDRKKLERCLDDSRGGYILNQAPPEIRENLREECFKKYPPK